MFRIKLSLYLLLVLPFQVIAAPFNQLIPVSYYGWLDQYSITDRHFVGDEACVPTSSTNAMTFFQNINPSIFGTDLSGTTYADWMSTDEILIDLMNTTVGNGTDDDRFVWGLSLYLSLMKEFPEVQFTGVFPPDDWSTSYPQPSYVQTGVPSIAFISNALAAGSAVLVGISYNHGYTGGHELLFNGLTWDPVTNTGTAYFIDPLDPSENYSPDVPTGPVKQTTGQLSLNRDGSIELNYNQYGGGLPYDGSNYSNAPAFLQTVLSVGGSFYAVDPGSKDERSIIAGFSKLDPTTAAMFPILAVLNTTSNLPAAFNQLDPSIYNNLLFSEQSVAHQLQTVLSNNLLQYRNRCCWNSADFCQRIWVNSFENCQYQRGGHHAAQSTYRNSIGGGVVGIDLSPCENLLTGCGFSYARTHLTIDNDIHASSYINSYGTYLYTALDCDRLRIDANFKFFTTKQAAIGMSLSHRRFRLFPLLTPFFIVKTMQTLYSSYLGDQL